MLTNADQLKYSVNGLEAVVQNMATIQLHLEEAAQIADPTHAGQGNPFLQSSVSKEAADNLITEISQWMESINVIIIGIMDVGEETISD